MMKTINGNPSNLYNVCNFYLFVKSADLVTIQLNGVKN